MANSWDLCTSADVKTALEISGSFSATRGAAVDDYIGDASLEIIGYCGRELAPATSSATRRFKVDPTLIVNGCVELDLFPYDLRTASACSLHPESSSPTALTQATDYVLLPVQAFDGSGTPVEPGYGVHTSLRFKSRQIFNSATYRDFGYCLLDITGAWGFSSVPGDVNQACVQTVCSWLRRDFPQFSQTEPFATEGQTLQPPPQGTYSIPSSALRKLQRFRRYGGVF